MRTDIEPRRAKLRTGKDAPIRIRDNDSPKKNQRKPSKEMKNPKKLIGEKPKNVYR